MSMLDNLSRTSLQPDQIMDTIKLYQYKGKDFYYQTVMKKDMSVIIKETIERECYAMVKILKLDVTENRLRLIIKKDSEPKTNDEKVVRNLKKIFTRLQENINEFDFITNQFQAMGRELYNGVKKMNFISRSVPIESRTLIQERKTVSTRDIFDHILKEYKRLLESNEYEPVMLVASFYNDFINSKVFDFGNEELGLLIIYVLLFKNRFLVFKYVSFFEVYLENQDAFKNCCLQASFNWNEGFAQITPLTQLITKLLNICYAKVDTKMRSYEIEVQQNKTDNLENTISKFPQVFTREMIKNKHPNVSDSTIDRTLKRMRDQNLIRPTGKGRSASWIRLFDNEQFNANSIKQISIFDDFDE